MPFEASQKAAAALAAQARCTAAHMVKCRARDYARRPMALETFIQASPRQAPKRSLRSPNIYSMSSARTRAAGSALAARSERSMPKPRCCWGARSGALKADEKPDGGEIYDALSVSRLPPCVRCRRTTTSTLAIS
jgi:hypothetical protein